MADDSEIDLYDNMDDNWKRENVDIYDDVEPQSPEEIQKETTQTSHTGRKVATYVGNLRWWTTDQDLLDAVHKLSIKDVIEIKFHENRQNGQSKGFCVMVFGSDKSAKEAMEKLPKTEIHGLAPIVTFCTKQNLNYFEQAAGGGSGSLSNSSNKTKTEMNRNNGSSTFGSSNLNNSNNTTTNMSQMQMNTFSGNMKMAGNMPLTNLPSLSQNILLNLQQNLQNINRNPNMLMQNPISTPLNISSNQMPMNTQRILQPSVMMQTGLPISAAGPTPHLNPNFFNNGQAGSLMNSVMNSQSLTQSSSTTTQYDTFGRPISSSFCTLSPKLSEGEFDEILQRNKTVSSSAISRAVQDASAGDYASAIETLVTAISLIKQSKIASDSRCKVLINSLQDTLTGIESKSYGSRKGRNRRRSFSDSSSDGDRDNSNEYSSRRVLRSRSRDRRRRSREYGNSRNNQGGSDFFSGIGSSSTSERYGSNRYRH